MLLTTFKRLLIPNKDKPERLMKMNLIVIMLDSFRQDHISFYNQAKPIFEDVDPCKTPNIDRFAKSASYLRTPIPADYRLFL